MFNIENIEKYDSASTGDDWILTREQLDAGWDALKRTYVAAEDPAEKVEAITVQDLFAHLKAPDNRALSGSLVIWNKSSDRENVENVDSDVPLGRLTRPGASSAIAGSKDTNDRSAHSNSLLHAPSQMLQPVTSNIFEHGFQVLWHEFSLKMVNSERSKERSGPLAPLLPAEKAEHFLELFPPGQSHLFEPSSSSSRDSAADAPQAGPQQALPPVGPSNIEEEDPTRPLRHFLQISLNLHHNLIYAINGADMYGFAAENVKQDEDASSPGLTDKQVLIPAVALGEGANCPFGERANANDEEKMPNDAQQLSKKQANNGGGCSRRLSWAPARDFIGVKSPAELEDSARVRLAHSNHKGPGSSAASKTTDDAMSVFFEKCGPWRLSRGGVHGLLYEGFDTEHDFKTIQGDVVYEYLQRKPFGFRLSQLDDPNLRGGGVFQKCSVKDGSSSQTTEVIRVLFDDRNSGRVHL